VIPAEASPFATAPGLPEPWRSLLTEIAASVVQTADHISRVQPGEVQSVLAEHRQTLYRAMDGLSVGISDFLAENPSPDEIEAIRAQIALTIQTWSATSPILNRLVRGTAGIPRDFEIPALVLENRRLGADLSAMIFNDYYLHSIAARAFRNRFGMLSARLLQEVVRRTEAGINPVQVLSLKCDTGREWPALVDEPELSAAQLTCLDEDSAALRAARANLGKRLTKQARFLRVSAMKYARSPSRSSEPYDICYAAALFDYLTNDQTVALIRDCYDLLAAGGTFILGSPTSGVPAKERVLGAWLMNLANEYRDEPDFRRLFAQTPFGSGAVEFERDPLGADMLVIAHRP
jgi:SAM-dependent methyltransferase